jgi:hypothetical protein
MQSGESTAVPVIFSRSSAEVCASWVTGAGTSPRQRMRKRSASVFESFSGSNPDLSKLGDVFTRMHQLAADAPSNVAADWKTLDGAITTLESALKAANIKPSDLAVMQKGQMPAGANLQKLQALAPKLEALSSSGVSSASTRISADAKKSCGIDLSSS